MVERGTTLDNRSLALASLSPSFTCFVNVKISIRTLKTLPPKLHALVGRLLLIRLSNAKYRRLVKKTRPIECLPSDRYVVDRWVGRYDPSFSLGGKKIIGEKGRKFHRKTMRGVSPRPCRKNVAMPVKGVVVKSKTDKWASASG